MKKRLSFFVALTLIVSSLFTSFNVNASFSDVTDSTRYKEAITALSNLDVINGYEDGTFGPDKDITRAEFTKLIVYMLGYGELSTHITQFEDVSDSHWANANIKTAYDLGIINGFSSTEFRPDSPVTYEQALKMVVCTLGYQADAEAQGGYPTGYRSAAASIDLNKSISDVAYEANAPRGVVAQILYNALEVKLREQIGNKWEKTNKTLLNDYLNVYKLKGTIVGVEDSVTNNCDSTLNPGEFAVDDDKTGTEYVINYTEFTKSLSEITAYLGKTVQIYYREDGLSTDKWLVAIDSETTQNKELTISSYDIDEYSNLNLKYYPSSTSKLTSLKIAKSDLTIRYNGRVVEGNVTSDDGRTYSADKWLELWLNPSSNDFIYGTVRLIDSGSSGSYNIIDIYDYETIVAYSSPISPDYRISDKVVTGTYLTLNPDASAYKFSLQKNGKDIATTSIASNDVINYAKSFGDSDYYITAYATAEKVTGKITSVNLTGNRDQSISIDNTEYHVSDRFLSYMANKEQKTLETGSSITAYKDALGTLEWGTISKSTSFYPYAYVIDIAQDGEDYFLKIFAPSSISVTSFTSSTTYKVKTVKIQANNPKLNTKKSSPDGIISALAANAAYSNPDADISNISGTKYTGYNQLIKVGFNVSGEISDVITFDPTSEGKGNDDSGLLVRYKAMNSDHKYDITSSSVKDGNTTLYSIKSATPLFVIPKDRTNINGYSLKSAVSSGSMQLPSSGVKNAGSYYLDAFDLSTTKYPSCLLVYNEEFKSGTAINYTAAYKLVSSDIKQEYDSEEDDIFNMLYTYNSATTETKTKIAKEADSEFDSVGKGDIILSGTNSDKNADSLIKAIDYDDIKAVLDKGRNNNYDSNGEIYNWTETQTQTAENNWQLYKLDFRYPDNVDPENVTAQNYYVKGGNGTDISSRAFMCNIKQVVENENMIYVTQGGFDESGAPADDNYTEIKVSSSTKIIRYDSDEKEFTPYAYGTTGTALTMQDLKDAENYASACSKVAITYVSGSKTTASATPVAKFIVIYE